MKKVKDLPKVLRLMLFDLFKSADICETDEAKIYLDAVKWDTRTDAERLAYCEVVYKGKEVVCLVDGHKYSSLKFRTQYSKNEVWANGAIKGDAGWSVCLYKNGKFAEIIEEVETIKEALFKVGDRPQWTPELIKQLPHGTMVKYCHDYEFVYNGEEPIVHENGNIYVIINDRRQFFVSGENCDFVEIISLPESLDQLRGIVRGSLEDQIKKASPIMVNGSEGVITSINPVEFKEGEIVDVWNKERQNDLQPAKYRFFASGKHWVETCAEDIVVNFKNIRKIDPDKDLKETADEVMKGSHSYTMDMDRKWIDETDVKSMLIEAMKKVQSKK